MPAKNRLPNKFVSKILSFGETGMGYTLFYFVFEGGEKVLGTCCCYCDFFDFDSEYECKNIVDVLEVKYDDPVERKPRIRTLGYYWCLYS